MALLVAQDFGHALRTAATSELVVPVDAHRQLALVRRGRLARLGNLQ